VASYRDTFRLLLAFAATTTGCSPSHLQLEALDTRLVERFLRHLEDERGNSMRTRNARLSAIHAYFLFVAINDPALELQFKWQLLHSLE